MQLRFVKKWVKSSEEAYAYFQQKVIGNVEINSLRDYHSFMVEIEPEEIFSTELLANIQITIRNILSLFWCNVDLDLNVLSRDVLVKSFICLIEDFGSLTKTEARNIFGKHLNVFKTKNISFTEEEIDLMLKGILEEKRYGKINSLNILFNGRKTMIKLFINMLGSKNIFDLSTENQIIYKFGFAIDKNICPYCGCEAIYGYDQNNRARFYCLYASCDAAYSNGDSEALLSSGIEALCPVRDRYSLFETGEKLIQAEITVSIHYRNFSTVMPKVLNALISSYNRGVIEVASGDKYKITTQPMGLKSYKKLLTSLEEIEGIHIVESKIVRLFNINNIEDFYSKAMTDEAITVLTGGEIIFDLTTMEVTVRNNDATASDCFEESVDANSYIFKNCNTNDKLFQTLEKMNEEVNE